MLELMSRLKDGSQNTWNMWRFAVSAPQKIELKKILIFGLGETWSQLVRQSKIKQNLAL